MTTEQRADFQMRNYRVRDLGMGWFQLNKLVDQHGIPYYVSSRSCTCPDWQYRRSKEGGKCKHQVMVQDLTLPQNQTPELHEILPPTCEIVGDDVIIDLRG